MNLNEGFNNLTNNERVQLLKAPVLVSVLAASYDQAISKNEKAEAIRFAHLKTFSAHPDLLEYYKKVDKDFALRFEMAVQKYTPFDDIKREALRKKIKSLNKVIAKLDKGLAKVLHKSLSDYTEHIKKVDTSILASFIFPIPIPGFIE